MLIRRGDLFDSTGGAFRRAVPNPVQLRETHVIWWLAHRITHSGLGSGDIG